METLGGFSKGISFGLAGSTPVAFLAQYPLGGVATRSFLQIF